jgi:hypothetical protein
LAGTTVRRSAEAKIGRENTDTLTTIAGQIASR